MVKTDGKTGPFLLRADPETSALEDVILMSGQAGIENSFQLLDLPLKGGEVEELYRPGGFSAYMLGWGNNFDQIIYMAVLSGKSEIQQYTISTGENVTLVPDLPLQ